MSTRADRAAARRATWTLRRVPRDDGSIPAAATAEERINQVFELSERAWKLSGRPWPDYERSDMPIVVIRAKDR